MLLLFLLDGGAAGLPTNDSKRRHPRQHGFKNRCPLARVHSVRTRSFFNRGIKIKSDSEFRIVQPQYPKDKPRDAIWIDPKGKARVLFLLLNGAISIKDPDERIIAKMKKVALRMKAKVGGDDGEDYK
jgi:hypothetical protein